MPPPLPGFVAQARRNGVLGPRQVSSLTPLQILVADGAMAHYQPRPVSVASGQQGLGLGGKASMGHAIAGTPAVPPQALAGSKKTRTKAAGILLYPSLSRWPPTVPRRSREPPHDRQSCSLWHPPHEGSNAHTVAAQSNRTTCTFKFKRWEDSPCKAPNEGSLKAAANK